MLVLSENAGAADELAPWALVVSPFDVGDQADALHRALELPADERRADSRASARMCASHDVNRWADELLAGLDDVPAAATRLRLTAVATGGVCREDNG